MVEFLPGSPSPAGDSFAARWSGRGAGLLAALFAVPLLGGLAIRTFVSGMWLRDLDAQTCAAWRMAHHATPYGYDLACPIGRPAAYLYLPQVAKLLAPLTDGVWAVALRAGLAAMVLVAAIFLVWVLFLRPMAGAPRLLRLSVLPLTTGGAMAIGNLGLICHALVLGVGLGRRRSPWPLIATIILVSMLKPIFLTYLLIFAYEAEPIWVRAKRIAAGLLLASLAAAVILATGGPELADWKAAVEEVALRALPGYGFISWMGALGFSAHSAVILPAFAAFAAIVSLSGLAIAEIRKLDGDARLLLALAVAQLVNPRPMTYDLLMLAPLVMAFTTGSALSRRLFPWALYGLGLVEVGFFLAGTDWGLRIGPAALTLALLVAAGLAVRDHQRSAGGWALQMGRPFGLPVGKSNA